jgi:hypothetical protein
LNREKVVGDIEAVRRKNGDASHEHVVDLLCRLSHRRCGGDDLGLDRAALQFPAAKLVYGGLIESDHRAQRTADEVEFVLDDQVWGPDRRDALNSRARQTFIGTVIAGAIGAGPKKPVPRALGIGPSEQSADFTPPRHQCELINCRDHHRRWSMINFLVDDQNRNARMWLLTRFALRELTASLLVPAVNCRP